MLFALSLTYSCKKDTEDVIECLTEEFLFSFHANVSDDDSKTYNFEITYSGDHAVDNTIKWDFGDGNVESLTGKTAQHTYSTSGSYKVQPTVTIRNGDAYCSPTFEKTINVE